MRKKQPLQQLPAGIPAHIPGCYI